MNIKTIIAKDREELDKVFEVRYKVFVEEGNYLNISDYPGGRECDSFDTLPTTDNILALNGIDGVGTVRVLRNNNEVAERMGWDIGLSIEELYDMSYYKKKGISIAEVPRSSIIKEYRDIKDEKGIPIISRLYKKVYNVCRRNNVSHICGVINISTDFMKDADIIMHVAKKRGLVTNSFMEPKTESKPESSTISFYHDIESADEEYLHELDQKGKIFKIPSMLHTVSLFGCKICGPPVYYKKFKRYVVPVELDLNMIPEPTKSYFESH